MLIIYATTIRLERWDEPCTTVSITAHDDSKEADERHSSTANEMKDILRPGTAICTCKQLLEEPFFLPESDPAGDMLLSQRSQLVHRGAVRPSVGRVEHHHAACFASIRMHVSVLRHGCDALEEP